MLSDINVGRYYSTSSKMHKMNPISKIILLLLIILMILISFDIMIIGSIVLITLIMLNSSIPYKLYLEILSSLKIILFILFLLFLPFGFLNSLMIIIKLIMIVLTLFILTLTTPTTEIIYGLEKVLYPLNRFRIKTNILALNIGLGLKLIPCLIDSRKNILKSQISRGIDYRSSLSNYIFATKNMLKPALKISKSKLKSIKNMMYIRLFSIEKERCNFRMNSWGIFDIILLIITGLILIFIIVKGLIL